MVGGEEVGDKMLEGATSLVELRFGVLIAGGVGGVTGGADGDGFDVGNVETLERSRGERRGRGVPVGAGVGGVLVHGFPKFRMIFR